MKLIFAAGLLATALLAIHVTPSLSAPANCMMESMGIDSEKVGGLLNVVLSIVIQLLYSKDDPCKKQELMKEMECAMGDMKSMMDEQSEPGKGLLGALLGPLLKAVGDLLQGLLGSEGVLGAVGDLLSNVLNLVLCLLKSLGLSVDVGLMTPTQCTPVPEAEAEPEPTALAEADPSPSGGGDLLDLDLLLSVDLSGLGDLLNGLLGLLVGLLGSTKCDYGDYAIKIQGLLIDLEVYVNLLGIEIQVNLLILLGPLLQGVLSLVAGLLNGLLGDVLGLVSIILNLLATLNLQVDLGVVLQLGNLLGLDLLALVKLG